MWQDELEGKSVIELKKEFEHTVIWMDKVNSIIKSYYAESLQGFKTFEQPDTEKHKQADIVPPKMRIDTKRKTYKGKNKTKGIRKLDKYYSIIQNND